MIGYLKGTVRDKKPEAVIVDVQGVGYLVHIPLTTFYKTPPAGSAMEFHVHTHVREDQISLFGFATAMELDIFRALISVTGLGPRKALTVLSGMEAEDLIGCLSAGDVTALSSIPGIGRKTAERLILELREKLPRYVTVPPAPAGTAAPEVLTAQLEDLLSALVNLGYPKPQADKAVRLAIRESPGETFETLLRRALKNLMGK